MPTLRAFVKNWKLDCPAKEYIEGRTEIKKRRFFIENKRREKGKENIEYVKKDQRQQIRILDYFFPLRGKKKKKEEEEKRKKKENSF